MLQYAIENLNIISSTFDTDLCILKLMSDINTFKIYISSILDNGDILLQPTIFDNKQYEIINIDSGKILIRKKIAITLNMSNINDIKNLNFSKSNILSCLVNNTISSKLKYKSILDDIYHIINDGSYIIRNSTFKNIKTIEKTNEGYFYHAYS